MTPEPPEPPEDASRELRRSPEPVEWKPDRPPPMTVRIEGSADLIADAYARGKRDGLLRAADDPATAIHELLATLNGDERLEILGDYCHTCGDRDPWCQCGNDE